MPRKRNPILGRALDFIALSITPMAKFRRPITRKLLLFKKAKRLKLFRHYHYAYIGAYEFSPSNTPLFYRPWDSKKKKKSRILSLLLCGGDRAVSVVDGGRDDELEFSSASGDGVEREPIEMAESGEDDEVSVDRRAVTGIGIMIEIMIGIMDEGAKGNEIEIVVEIETETETEKGIETAIGQEMKRNMVERGIEKGIGKVESGREGTETADGTKVVPGAGAGTVENETVKMVSIARGVLVAVQVLGGVMGRTAAPGMSLRRRKKRKKRKVMVLITQTLKLLRPTGFVLLSVWHRLSYETTFDQ